MQKVLVAKERKDKNKHWLDKRVIYPISVQLPPFIVSLLAIPQKLKFQKKNF